MATRSFLSLAIPDRVATRLTRLVAPAPAGIRRVPATMLHLTLHFLGDLDDPLLAWLARALQEVHHPAFALTISGTGVFPARGRPTVLWAGVAPDPPLLDLHAKLAAVLATLGIAVEARPYRPHITLARSLPEAAAWATRFPDTAATLSLPQVSVTAFLLMASDRNAGGVEHMVVGRYPLAASP